MNNIFLSYQISQRYFQPAKEAQTKRGILCHRQVKTLRPDVRGAIGGKRQEQQSSGSSCSLPSLSPLGLGSWKAAAATQVSRAGGLWDAMLGVPTIHTLLTLLQLQLLRPLLPPPWPGAVTPAGTRAN